ncbi:hypothetical protein [Legionella brunensis]|uniref:Interaptin n=1 Tax=Legionella brunensis TaxID=29422 RepID=A0A0W0S1M0_9GAMM|nr:hypothetical protein [Legionella brunensis]KTC77033.1 interaptin [Legionella brunensis]
MPAVNNTLLAALQNAALLKKPAEALQVLNKMLEVSHTTPDAFRKAIIDQGAIWNGLGVNFNPTGFAHNNDNDLKPDGDVGMGAVPAQDFQALFKLAAEKRMIIALQNADEAALKAIIEQDNRVQLRNLLAHPDGRTKLGAPAGRIANWNPNDESVLTNDAVDRIRFEAQRQLLLKKISSCQDINQINALLTAGGQPAFQAALNGLGIAPSTSPKMLLANPLGNLQRLVANEAAKKGIELHFANNPPLNLNTTLVALQDPTASTFLNAAISVGTGFPAPYRTALQDADAPWVRALVGKKYLEQALSIGNNKDALKNIASQTDLNALKDILQGGNNANDLYLNAAVTAENLASIRQAAATRALQLKIAELDDVETLNALMKVTSVADIKNVLASNTVLGYQTENSFHSAFSDPKSVQQIVAAAYVRKSLYSAKDATRLRQMLNEPNPDFNVGWGHFTQGRAVPPGVAEYFKNPDNVKKARQQALISLAKSEDGVKALSPDQLATLAYPTSVGLLKGAVRVLLGRPATSAFPGEDDVIHQNAYGDYEKTLSAYAAMEATLRVTKKIDLRGNNFADFIININNLNIADPTAIHGATRELAAFDLSHLNVGALVGTLPQKEQQAFRARLVENLVSNYPEDGDLTKLKKLTQAKDIDTFKAALTDMGITEQGWVNKDSMASVQKAAAAKTIALSLDQYSRFDNHDALIKVIEQLPLATQQVILAKPEIMRTLMDAHGRDVNATSLAIVKALGGDITIDPALLTAAAEENLQHARASKIVNAQVAKIIGEMTLDNPLTEAQVKAINDVLLDPSTDFNGPTTEYKRAVDRFAQVLGMDPEDLYVGFGYDSANRTRDDVIQEAIQDQRDHNQHLIARYGITPSATNKAVMQFLMTLEKEDEFPDAQINTIVGNFYESSSSAEFLGKLQAANLVNPPAPRGTFNRDDLKEQLTPEAFKDAKASASKAVFLSSDQTNIARLIDLQTKERNKFTDLHKEITEADKKIHKQLKLLSETKVFDWFNPAFQATAKENAREMLEQYTELDKVSNSMVKFYRNEITLLNEQLASIPQAHELPVNTPQWRKDKLKEYRDELNKQLDAAQKELERYEGVQRLLRGNPIGPDNSLLKKGLLKTLQEAQVGKDVKFLAFKSKIDDYPISQKQSLLSSAGNETVDLTANLTVRRNQITPEGYKHFDTEKPIPAGCIRNHTIGTVGTTGPIYSKFLEERKPEMARVNSKGQVEYVGSSSFTVRQPPPPTEEKATKEFYMALAMQVLKDGPPTADDPIYLDDGDEDQVKNMWMALMVIGRNVPGMEFDSSAIKVSSTAGFNPNQHIKKDFFGKGESIINLPEYETWKTHPSVLNSATGMKEFSTVKLGEKREEAKEKTNTAASDVVKSKLKDIKPKVEQVNTEQENKAPTVPGQSS